MKFRILLSPISEMTPGSDDTIVALASGRGEAGIAIVRLSGPAALSIRDNAFRPAKSRTLDPSRLIYGTIVDHDGTPIDDCLAVSMPAPHSFTGEDVVEFQCHGSPAVIRRIIELCLGLGARAAEPGEFSRRAFFNGKMDLAQAEALSDLIAAKSEAARRMSLQQLRGGLSQKLRQLYSQLIDAAAQIEAHLDFPEEDIPDLSREAILRNMTDASTVMAQLLHGHEKARVQVEGARVILAGEPNAGKSSLFNALVGRERAIVSPHPGTTRDTIEATVEIGGLAVTLVDTAGIRTGAGEIEQIGIDRTWEEIQNADLVLHLADDPMGFSTDVAQGSDKKLVKVWTKQDLQIPQPALPPDHLPVSSATGQGLQELEARIYQQLLGEESSNSDSEMSRVRHAVALRASLESLQRAMRAFSDGESGDLVMVDLRDALSSIGEILGERLDEQILDRIFSTFCLGK